jgi:hypothetical protein
MHREDMHSEEPLVGEGWLTLAELRRRDDALRAYVLNEEPALLARSA